MRISDWSSDVCSSDLAGFRRAALPCGDEGIVAGEQGVEEERDRAAARTRYVDRAGGARQPKRIDEQSGMRAVGERGRGRSEADAQIGRASCRERVCQSVSISVVDV